MRLTHEMLKKMGWKIIHENKKAVFALRLDSVLKAEFCVWKKIRNEKFSFFDFSSKKQPKFFLCEPFCVSEDDMSEGVERAMSRMMGESKLGMYVARQRALDFHISNTDDFELGMDLLAIRLQN